MNTASQVHTDVHTEDEFQYPDDSSSESSEDQWQASKVRCRTRDHKRGSRRLNQLTWMQSSEDEENEARHQARQKRLQGLQKGLLGVNKAKDMLMKFKTKSSAAPSKAAESKAAKGQKSR